MLGALSWDCIYCLRKWPCYHFTIWRSQAIPSTTEGGWSHIVTFYRKVTPAPISWIRLKPRCVRELVDALKREKTGKKQQPQTVRLIEPWQTVPKQAPTVTSVSDESDQWEMAVDLKKILVFPDIVQTTLKPDIAIRQRQASDDDWIDSWQSRCDEAYERKKTTYSELKGGYRGRR